MADGTGSQFSIDFQYLKDHSFENPNAPDIYSKLSEGSPKLDIQIDVQTRQLAEQRFEVVLKISARAAFAEQTGFHSEIEYAGLVTLHDTSDSDQVEHLLLIETPRMLFPFARSILADATRDGGFPPLVIQPVDFAALYRRRRQQGEASASA